MIYSYNKILYKKYNRKTNSVEKQFPKYMCTCIRMYVIMYPRTYVDLQQIIYAFKRFPWKSVCMYMYICIYVV